ncbi:MAG: hypothetical protein B6D41_02220 [Chloroflexi bacterium UTCFX4]|nr:MAG: hypothetical protein B6D41_02220 [Chloroflexi bacterium UTCFX4]
MAQTLPLVKSFSHAWLDCLRVPVEPGSRQSRRIRIYICVARNLKTRFFARYAARFFMRCSRTRHWLGTYAARPLYHHVVLISFSCARREPLR